MLRAGLAVAATLLSLSADAQTSFWQREDTRPAKLPARAAPASRYTLLRIDVPAMAAYLQSAARSENRSLELPLPDGNSVSILLERVDVLVPELAAENPEIQTFKGTSADGRYSTRLTVSPYGASARISTPDGLVYMQPLMPSAPEWSAVFFARDAEHPGGVLCGVENADDEDEPMGKTAAFTYGDANLRTYVMAVAATGEYTVWAGGGTANQAAALAQITTVVNNVNAIYERDLGVTFTLTSPLGIRYTDPAADPYTTTLSGTTLNDNQTAIDAVVGNGNYDLGHVFGAQWSGGLAQRPAVCVTGKGRAASGLDPAIFTTTGPSGPVFDGTVAHEIGHQFNGTHSYAANNGGCGGGNISASTGWEPGGGSTIMAYAGTCTGNSYQNNSDLYFHAGNLSQMGTYMQGSGNGCADLTTPANAAPVLTVGSTAFTIPHSTPFRLTALATDANNTGITYTHEQLDAVGGTGTSSAPSSASTTGPQFRSFPPSTSGTRYLPNLTSILAASSTPYEVLPSDARTMNFRVTARDNNAGFGRTSAENVVVTTAACGPFSITSQSTATSLASNGANTMTVTWNTASCVTCANVTLKLIRDGGETFSTILSATPNDGTETFAVPNLPTCSGRLYMECTSAPFFSVNSASVAITSTCAAEGTTFSPATALSVPAAGDLALNQTLTAQYGTQYSSPITGNIATTDPQTTLAMLNSGAPCINFSNVTRYDSYTFYPSSSSTYTFNAAGSTSPLVYNLYEGSFSAAAPCTNLLTSSGNYTTGVALGSSISAALCRGKQYTLVVMTFDPTQPALPAPYTIAVSGGSIFNGVPNPGFNYGFVIVNAATGNIVSIQTSGSMTNVTTFPTGLYTVYGLSTNSSLASLNTTYANTSFDAFTTAVLSQSGGVCASLSTNSRSVTVNPTALALTDVRLEASLTGRRSAYTSWTVIGSEAGLRRYELERSYDGANFETAAVVAVSGASRYERADDKLHEDAAGVHYRVAMRGLSGDVRYSSAKYLPFEGAVSPAIVVAPNPILGGMLRAEVGASAAGAGTASVIDATGRVVLSTPLALLAGKQRLELPVGSLSAGVYLLRIDGAGAPLQVRFVKSR